MSETPALICEACIALALTGHTCRQFVPFAIELRLKDTIASLPKRLRARLGKQGINPRRGDTTIQAMSDEPQLIDELLRNHGAIGGSGSNRRYTMIARVDQQWRWQAWVIVHHVSVDAPSPFSSFMRQLRVAVKESIDRGIAAEDAVHYLFEDGREFLASAAADKAERDRKARYERALVVAEKLKALSVSQIAALAVERQAFGVRALEALEEMIAVPEGKTSEVKS